MRAKAVAAVDLGGLVGDLVVLEGYVSDTDRVGYRRTAYPAAPLDAFAVIT